MKKKYNPFAPKLIPVKDVKVGQKFRCGENIFLKIQPSLSSIGCVNLTTSHVVVGMKPDTEVHAL